MRMIGGVELEQQEVLIERMRSISKSLEDKLAKMGEWNFLLPGKFI